MATSVPTPPKIFGTNLKSMKKAPLQNICIAMGFEDIKSSGNKDGLISLIESMLDNFPVNLIDDPRFTNLLQARKKVARLQASERAKTSDRKNSAGKVAEDLADASIPLKGITGANSSFSSRRPHLSRLRVLVLSLYKDRMEVPSRDLLNEKFSVVVRLLHPTDKDQPTQQVIVNDVKIIETKASDGSVEHQAELTHLLPKAINNSSPIKGDPRGRFSCPGVGAGQEDDRLSVGTVAQHLDGTASTHANLSFKAGNRIPLDPQEDVYECELYFQPSNIGVPIPFKLTGAGSDRPLDIAIAWRNEAPPPAHTLTNETANFTIFLRQLAKYPEPFEKVQLTYTGVAYDSHISMTAYLKSFKPFYKGARAVIIFPLTILRRTGLWSPTTVWLKGILHNLRQCSPPEEGSEIGKWLRAARPTPLGEDEDLALVDNNDVSPFEYMKTAEFKELVDDALKDLADQKPSLNKAGASSSCSVSKKRTREDRDGNGVDGEGSSKKRKRNKGDEKKKSKRQREKRKEKGGTSSITKSGETC
ncbi:hypothetical protein C8R46DRAFT_1035782 [Mycena filopes]|nr:hypothetical protein C8R46DRAFT_1035782 [Mycena filopes]